MAAEQSSCRIGIVDQTTNGWAAGSSYTKMLVYSLGSACQAAGEELYFFSHLSGNGAASLPVKRITLSAPECLPGEQRLRSWLGLSAKLSPVRGEWRLRRWLDRPDESNVFFAARKHRISVLLPVTFAPAAGSPLWDDGTRIIGWIPDFQHVFLPDYFPEAERRQRDNAFANLAECAARVMLSSQSAAEHFAAFAPKHAQKAVAVPFPSLLAFEPIAGDGFSSRARFNLPAKFALVANQFWRHKNHQLVVEAVARLKQLGLRIPIVMTGLPVDYRDPANQVLSRLLQAIAAAGLAGQVIILGQVEYQDLVNLMRAAAVVIQPSRFEGWSTSVQDAKALGRPLLCSDIPVHREQAPAALGFFPCDRDEVLADLLAAHWDELLPGPDPAAEQDALAREREFARLHGGSLLDVCREACGAAPA